MERWGRSGEDEMMWWWWESLPRVPPSKMYQLEVAGAVRGLCIALLSGRKSSSPNIGLGIKYPRAFICSLRNILLNRMYAAWDWVISDTIAMSFSLPNELGGCAGH